MRIPLHGSMLVAAVIGSVQAVDAAYGRQSIPISTSTTYVTPQLSPSQQQNVSRNK